MRKLSSFRRKRFSNQIQSVRVMNPDTRTGKKKSRVYLKSTIVEIIGDINGLEDVRRLIKDIKLQELGSSQAIALKTADLVEALLQSNSWNTAKELLDRFRDIIKEFSLALEQEMIPLNILLHFMKVVREEYEAIFQEKQENPPHQIFTARQLSYSEQSSLLKTNLLNHFAEYREELVSSTENIANQAHDLIYENDTLLTMGHSKTVEQFLMSIKDKNPKIIIVLESTSNAGQELAERLEERNFKVTLIYESNVFSVLPQVDKVILSPKAIMGSTKMRVMSGAFAVVLAANEFAVPVIALAQTYKMCPVPHKEDTFADMGNSELVLSKSAAISQFCDSMNFSYDYIPLTMVNTLITQQGKVDPSYTSMLHSDMYSSNDYEIFIS